MEINTLNAQCMIWDEVIAQTDMLKKSKAFPNLVMENLVSFQDIYTVLNSMSRDHSEGYSDGLRVYINNAISHDYERRIIDNPPQLDIPLENWAKTIFNDNAFGIVINQSEKWSDDLSFRISNFLKLLRERLNRLYDTVEIVIFLGNYGYTPFGIHYDGDYVFNIHLHLGPGEKHMYLWEPKLYKQITGSYDFCHTPSDIIHTGERHVISPNSMYVLPAGFYHVGYTENFSVGIALAMSKSTNKKLIQESVKIKLENTLAQLPDYGTGFYAKTVTECENIAQGISSNIFEGEVLLKDFIKEALQENFLRTLSNSGFANAPDRKHTNQSDIFDKKIKKVEGFNIYFGGRDRKNNIPLYIRGYRIVVKFKTEIMELIRRINEGNVIVVREYIEGFKDVLTRKEVCDLLTLIFSYNGILIMSS